MAEPVILRWASNECPIPSRYDAWVGKLNEAFGHWDARPTPGADFFADLKTYDDEILRIIDCTCDPCAAKRNRSDIAVDVSETLTIQKVIEGRESIDFNGQQIILNPGDLLVWDSTKPMSFNVEQRLHKISVVLPLHRFRCWFPRSWASVKRWIDGQSCDGQLLSTFIDSLSWAAFQHGCRDDHALVDATIGMLANTLGVPKADSALPLRELQLQFTKEYIHTNIRNSLLSPASIAHANNMSLRYLHWLFNSCDETVSEYIIRRRLKHCMRDLSNPKMRQRKITDIAIYWGFRDVTHFSKRFKREFGLSPNNYRLQAKA